MITATLDPEKQKQAKQYARIHRRVWLLDTLASAVYLLAWLFFGWAKALASWLRNYTTNDWLLVLAFIIIFGGIAFILELPLSYYSGFVLPHHFDQSNQDFRGWVMDQLKNLLIAAPLGLIVLELVYLALRLTGGWWWLWTGAGMLVFSVLLSNLAPILIMPLFNKFVPLGEEHAELAGRLMKLAERSHTKVRGVFKFDMSKRTRAANAALTGLGNTRRIVLGDTLINEFSADEIETVLAHELGHHVHKDIPILMAFGTVMTLGGLFLASLVLHWASVQFGFAGPADIAGLPALGLVLGAFGLLTQPLDNAVSRWRESQADEYALQSTGNGAAFASAFVRLANQNLGEVDPEKWVVFMFYDHPPLGERIKMASEIAGN
ncbi:MAG: M48 family metallopeptidase [Anaerolineales bacterium]|jgi:STE24 endopeptidase